MKDDNQEKVENILKEMRNVVTKPCLELDYCPYGPLVENFPILGPTKKEAIQNNDVLKEKLENGDFKKEVADAVRKKIDGFDPDRYPESHDEDKLKKQCSVFGHLCPVFFVSEPWVDEEADR